MVSLKRLSDSVAFPALTAAASAAGDLFVVYDVSAGLYKSVTRAELSQALGIGGVILGGSKTGANLNITTDQAIAISCPTTNWLPQAIVALNPSTSLAASPAQGGIYTAASKGGGVIVRAAQLFTGLTTATKNAAGSALELTVNKLWLNVTTIYLSLTTGHGSAATLDLYVFIRPLA